MRTSIFFILTPYSRLGEYDPIGGKYCIRSGGAKSCVAELRGEAAMVAVRTEDAAHKTETAQGSRTEDAALKTETASVGWRRDGPQWRRFVTLTFDLDLVYR